MSSDSNRSDADNVEGKGHPGLLPVFYETAGAHEQYIQSCSGVSLPDNLQAIPTALQAFAANYFTGKVEIFNKQETAAIFFERGALIHAELRAAKGDNAVREAISWLVGACSYNTEHRASERSITRHIQSLIREGFVLLDQKKFLSSRALFYESTLKKEPVSNQAELKKTLGELQRKIFSRLEGICTLTDVIRDLELETWEWVSAIFHLLDMHLIKIDQPRSKDNALAFIDATKCGVHALESEMRSTQTGLYNYEALILYLQRELHFYHEYKKPLSLIVLEMQSVPTGATGGKAEWLPSQSISAVEGRFDLIKKPLDLFGHFEESDFALILPNTSQSQAEFLAKRLAGSLAKFTLNINMRPCSVNLHCGIATVPDIGSELQTLISAAKIAKSQAKNTQQTMEIASLYTASLSARGSGAGMAHDAEPLMRPKNKFGREDPVDMKELLLAADMITSDQLEQASALMSRMPVPLSLGRVLAMQGHMPESTVNCAAELCKMIEERRLSLQQSLKIIDLVANHGLDMESALKRMGIARKEQVLDSLGELLRDAHLVSERRLAHALRRCAVTELPLDIVLVCTGMLPRTLVHAAHSVSQMMAAQTLTREQAIDALQLIHHRSHSLEQALDELSLQA